MMFAPLEGWRHVKVTDRHTAVDYARVLKGSADIHFAHEIHATLGNICCGDVRGRCRGDLWIPDVHSPRPLLWIQGMCSQSCEGCRLVNDLASVVDGIYR